MERKIVYVMVTVVNQFYLQQSCFYKYIIRSHCLHIYFYSLVYGACRVSWKVWGWRWACWRLVGIREVGGGVLQDYDWGCWREGFGALRWEDKGLDVWLGGWEGEEGFVAAVVGCSWQSGDNQQPDLHCLTSLLPVLPTPLPSYMMHCWTQQWHWFPISDVVLCCRHIVC